MELINSEIIELLQDYKIGLPIFILFGLIFGSFATMASYRLPRDEDTVITPSHCPNCNHKLAVLDLIPVFSWIFNKRKCRYCSKRVSARYPLTEVLMASLFVIIYLKFGISLTAISMLGLAVCLVILIITDIEHRIIPDQIQIFVLLLGILYRYSLNAPIHEYFTGILLGLFIALALRFGFYFIRKREGLGMGDVKFFAAGGIFLGIKLFIPFLFFSGIFGIIFSLFWKKLFKEEEFPFGPALAISMLLCLIFPEYAIQLFYYSDS